MDDSSSVQGLDGPVWRQTTLVDTGELIEATPLPTIRVVTVPDGASDIKTTICYGQTQTRGKSRMQRNLMKGIHMATAVFLLGAMVWISATAACSGSWTENVWNRTGKFWGSFRTRQLNRPILETSLEDFGTS